MHWYLAVIYNPKALMKGDISDTESEVDELEGSDDESKPTIEELADMTAKEKAAKAAEKRLKQNKRSNDSSDDTNYKSDKRGDGTVIDLTNDNHAANTSNPSTTTVSLSESNSPIANGAQKKVDITDYLQNHCVSPGFSQGYESVQQDEISQVADSEQLDHQETDVVMGSASDNQDVEMKAGDTSEDEIKEIKQPKPKVGPLTTAKKKELKKAGISSEQIAESQMIESSWKKGKGNTSSNKSSIAKQLSKQAKKEATDKKNLKANSKKYLMNQTFLTLGATY